VTVPPFQREPTQEQMVITVWLNLVRPLSEPKWCRGNSADEWLIEQFGARKASTDGGWKGKLEVIDPDPVSSHESPPGANTDPRPLRCPKYYGRG